jgi:hypothetical protein
MSVNFWEIGKSYFVRTVTMYQIGKLKAFSDTELVFEKASWIADCGRFHDALKNGKLEEVEPFLDDVCINRSAMIDATIWNHPLPSEQK